MQENKVPPVINKYQNPSKLIYPCKQQYLRYYNNNPQIYQPIISDNLLSLQFYQNKEEINYNNIFPSTQRKTLINITPMTTMDISNSGFQENISTNYDENENMYNRNKRIQWFITLSPRNYDIEPRNYENVISDVSNR